MSPRARRLPAVPALLVVLFAVLLAACSSGPTTTIPPEATGGVPVEDLPLDQFIEPASNRQILARVLRNLKGIYRQADDPARLLDVLNRMLVLSPRSRSDLRDRGLVYQRLECWRPALQDLTDYLDLEPDAADLAEIRARVIELRGRCARLN